MRTLYLLGFLLLMAPPQAVSSQTGASLDQVDSLLAEGRIAEAREALEVWWNVYRPAATRAHRQQGIWLRGKLTVDPSMAEADFRRLVLEYPGGLLTDDALFRLALLAESRGDDEEAGSFLQTLLRDYPSSPLLEDAERWLSRVSVGFPGRTPRPRAGPGSGVSETPPVEVGDFSIQLGAFREPERARVLANRLREANYRARLVRTPGDGLTKVRVGRFNSRPEARALARELEDAGFSTTLVTDAGGERPVGRGEPGPG